MVTTNVSEDNVSLIVFLFIWPNMMTKSVLYIAEVHKVHKVLNIHSFDKVGGGLRIISTPIFHMSSPARLVSNTSESLLYHPSKPNLNSINSYATALCKYCKTSADSQVSIPNIL